MQVRGVSALKLGVDFLQRLLRESDFARDVQELLVFPLELLVGIQQEAPDELILERLARLDEISNFRGSLISKDAVRWRPPTGRERPQTAFQIPTRSQPYPAFSDPACSSSP